MKTSAKIVLITLGVALIGIIAVIFWAKKQIDSNIIKASGITETQTIIPEAFDKIHISGGYSVRLHYGDKHEVKVEADKNFLKLIEVTVNEGTLNIENRKTLLSGRAKIAITCPSVSDLKLSGGVELESEDMLSVPHFTMNTSAGSTVKLNGTFEIFKGTLSAGSSLTLLGIAKSAEFNLSAGSTLDGDEFAADSCYLTTVAGSSAEIISNHYLEVEATSGSEIRYSGSPSVGKQMTSSGGTIRKIE